MEYLILKLTNNAQTPHPIELSQRIAQLHGVERSVFQPDEHQILIAYDPMKISAATLHESIRNAGYTFPEDKTPPAQS
jgi:hypothetical protein